MIQPRCPVCGHEAGADTVACPRCAVAHHRDCWEYQNERCAIYGCAPAAPPAASPAPHRSWGTYAYLICALLLGIARGAAQSQRRYEPPPLRLPTELSYPQVKFQVPQLEKLALAELKPIKPLEPQWSPASRKLLDEMVAKGQISCRIVHGRNKTCPRCEKK